MAEIILSITAKLTEEEIAIGKLVELISIVQGDTSTANVDKANAVEPTKEEKSVTKQKNKVEESEVEATTFDQLDEIFRSAVKIDKVQVSSILKDFGVKGLSALKESITNGDTYIAEVIKKLEEVA